jgi:hypothetical protein
MDTVRPRTSIRKSTDTLSRRTFGRISAERGRSDQNAPGVESEQIPRDGIEQRDKEADR